jgi:hypothetical protein
MSNGTGKSAQGRLRNIMRIIIESGLMYSAIALLTFATIIVGSNAVYVTSDMVSVPLYEAFAFHSADVPLPLISLLRRCRSWVLPST